MDTRFWGPSAWQLFHLIAFRSEYPDQFLLGIKDYLPCRFCRESTTEFVHENPLRGDPGKWLYALHNMVNDKLRKQAKTDPTVVNPEEDPSFEEVKKRYMEMKPVAVPGRDYLFAVAANFSEHPESADMCRQRVFHHALSEVYPFEALRKVYTRYLKDHEVDLRSRKSYMKWTYGLLSALSKSIRAELPPFKGYAHHVAYYRSGCSKKTYHGKTCRKLVGGGRTKDRDHRKTYRVAHRNLISS
jgi:hypothetical protein